MTDPIAAAILGVVEGITEFLPVSSTAHLLITERLMFHSAQKPEWVDDLFNVVIQTGAVLAVIPLFHHRFHQFIFNWRDKTVRDYFLKIVVAFFITGAGGYVMEKKGFKLPEQLLPVAIALLTGGVLFLIVERWLAARGGGQDKDRGDLRNVTWTVAVAVGVGQVIAAAFPGSSRSGTSAGHGILLFGEHPDHARRRRLQDFRGFPSSGRRRPARELVDGHYVHGDRGGRVVHRRQMASALCADAHFQRLRLVSHSRERGPFRGAGDARDIRRRKYLNFLPPTGVHLNKVKC
jgi:undecaprenyl pyrophosphate phosphatase UppP